MKFKTQNAKFKTTVQNLKLFIFALWLCALTFTLFTFPVFAQEDIGYSRLTPASPLYFLKAVRESFEQRFTNTPGGKLALHLEFSFRRLREAKTLLSQNQELIAPTLERYNSEMNSLPDKDLGKDPFKLKIIEAVNIDLASLEQMYSQTPTLGAKMAIRAAMNRIIQRADVSSAAGIPVCVLFSKEASSSALNSTEKVVLAQRAEDCFKKLK